MPDWGEDEFEMWIGNGGGLSGYDTLHLRSDGKCEWFCVGENAAGGFQYKRAEFKVQNDVVSAVRVALAELNILELKANYHARVHDGAQRFVRVVIGTRSRQI